MPTKAPSKRRTPDHGLLFPGLTLTNKVHKIQYATQIVGEVFERMTESIVGDQWSRLCPEIDADVRPDMGTADGLNYIESKACQHRFKVNTYQLNRYADLVSDHAKLGHNCNVVYFMWQYGDDRRGDHALRLVQDGKTLGGLIKLLTDNVRALHIVHWSIIAAMRAKLPENVTWKSYPSWKVSIESGRDYESMCFGEPFFRRLRENPALTLYKELHLNPKDYHCRSEYQTKSASIDFDGTEFKSSSFPIHRYVSNKNYVAFPEFRKAKEAAMPF